ncbi:MAG: B12-binding domain-containing radical SAM protein [Candidatus Cloacimonetes bacterium]|nr:B12-binding domain-containing radical SAM protein [Candidatus Cloacimonadota bacterium]
MRVLLVSPKSIIGGLESLRKGNQILQGLLYIAAATRDAGHEVTLVIANKDDIDQYINKYKPEILGVSCVTSTYPIMRDLLIYTKEKYPKLKTIIGGHHATFMYKEVIAETDVSYVCRGEGEEVFTQLLAEIEKGNTQPEIEGIVYKKDGDFHNDGKIAIMENIEDLPLITRDLCDPQFTFSPKIVSSRGCPFHCSFCSISAFYGGSYRKRSVKKVIEEIKEFMSWGEDSFWFHDDNLTLDVAWMNDFCDAIEKEGLNFNYNCMSRVDTICKNPELFARMAKTGCSLVSIGIESGIPEVLEKMHKKINVDQILEAIKIMNKLSISHNWYMILGSGDEFDTPEHLKTNIRFFSKLPLGYVLISILTPFPGTEVYNNLRAENRIRHYNWEDYDAMHCVYEPTGFSYEVLEKALPKAYLKVYLSKGWRLIPLFIQSFKRKAMDPSAIGSALKTMFKYVFLRKNFQETLKK